jgi:hypothetical protein
MVSLPHVQLTWVLVRDNQSSVSSPTLPPKDPMKRDLKILPDSSAFKQEEWEDNILQWTQREQLTSHHPPDSVLRNLMLLRNFTQVWSSFTSSKTTGTITNMDTSFITNRPERNI